MAQPQTRAQFKEWCLRKLGKPVLEVNVDDDQVEDRIDEALSFYYDYHFDGTEKTYVKYQVTAQDRANGWIPVPENVIGVVNVFPVGGILSGSGIFNAQYQFVLNNIHDFASYDMINYVMTFQHLAFMQELLTGKVPLRYNRHVNKLYLDTDWKRINDGEYVVYECYKVVDPETYSDVWKDRWLGEYATALIQEMWGRNLTKFVGMQLPGGLTFNGEYILQDAKMTIQQLRTEISAIALPPLDLLG